jgi:hypothetical protein
MLVGPVRAATRFRNFVVDLSKLGAANFQSGGGGNPMRNSDLDKTFSRRGLTPEETFDHCYHEASHALVAIRLGLGLAGKVMVIPQGEGWREFGLQQIWFGMAEVERNGSDEEMAMFFLAGIAAERHRNPRPKDTGHWEGDRREYYRLFPDGNRQIEHLCAAEQLVERNWPSVEAVALALFSAKSTCLPADDVKSIVKQYPPDPECGGSELCH